MPEDSCSSSTGSATPVGMDTTWRDCRPPNAPVVIEGKANGPKETSGTACARSLAGSRPRATRLPSLFVALPALHALRACSVRAHQATSTAVASRHHGINIRELNAIDDRRTAAAFFGKGSN